MSNSNSATTQTRPPPVLWAQRADLIFLTIDIEDCEAPKIELQKDKLYFRGQSDSIQSDNDHVVNEVTVEFNKPINVEESKYSVKARGVEFVIKKEESGWWPRLLKDSKKQHWLKVDFYKWKDEDDSEDEFGGMGGMGGAPDFGDFMQQFGGGMGGGGMPGMGGMGEEFEGDDDEEEEDDDDTEKDLPDLEDAKNSIKDEAKRNSE